MPVGPNLPYGYTIFCEDIREEVGGKRSLMGVYSGDMVFQGQAPGIIPSFVAQINWLCGRDSFPSTIEFVLYKDTDDRRESLFAAKIDSENLPPLPAPTPDKHDPDAPAVASFQFQARFSNLEFDGPCRLRVRALVDGVEHRIGAIAVGFGMPVT